ncbi:MAG: hypothetical protein NT022_11795 [Deltaproteobacteria bacterium]|nr:hypothetical protein [Deltaproteobacteria bacterium]
MDKAKWTFMVYMAGDNSLDGAALKDLAEMAQGRFHQCGQCPGAA